MHTLILGCGFSGRSIARALATDGRVGGTRREPTALGSLRERGIEAFALDGTVSGELRAALGTVTHLVSSVAPGRQPPLDDPMLDLLRPLIEAGGLPALAWIGYLSTIGVYGDHGGGWVDEDTPCTSAQPRSIARVEAERAWSALGERAGVPVALFRLSGIYGPGRNAVRDALAGRARVLIKPGQVFNRIHVDDLASAVALAARRNAGGVFNVTDDLPAPSQDVVRHAHDLVGRSAPPAVAFEDAELSPMALSFYAESKRVSNARSKKVLGLQYRYPDYRVGLAALLGRELEDGGD